MIRAAMMAISKVEATVVFVVVFQKLENISIVLFVFENSACLVIKF